MKDFKSYWPENLEEALDLMADHHLIPLAGGTDLMIRARHWQGARRNFKRDVILISHLKGLKVLEENEAFYTIGAGVTQAEVLKCSFLPDYIKEVVSLMATPAIRNAATIGGNVVNAASVADLLPLLYVTDSRVVLASKYGCRTLAIEKFITGKYQTQIKQDELLLAIEIPKYEVLKYYYKKIGQRKASILSKISFLGLHLKDEDRLAIGALNDLVIRSRENEQLIQNKESIDFITSSYHKLYKGHDSKRSTRAYQEKITDNLLNYWLQEVLL